MSNEENKEHKQSKKKKSGRRTADQQGIDNSSSIKYFGDIYRRTGFKGLYEVLRERFRRGR